MPTSLYPQKFSLPIYSNLLLFHSASSPSLPLLSQCFKWADSWEPEVKGPSSKHQSGPSSNVNHTHRHPFSVSRHLTVCTCLLCNILSLLTIYLKGGYRWELKYTGYSWDKQRWHLRPQRSNYADHLLELCRVASSMPINHNIKTTRWILCRFLSQYLYIFINNYISQWWPHIVCYLICSDGSYHVRWVEACIEKYTYPTMA